MMLIIVPQVDIIHVYEPNQSPVSLTTSYYIYICRQDMLFLIVRLITSWFTTLFAKNNQIIADEHRPRIIIPYIHYIIYIYTYLMCVGSLKNTNKI